MSNFWNNLQPQQQYVVDEKKADLERLEVHKHCIIFCVIGVIILILLMSSSCVRVYFLENGCRNSRSNLSMLLYAILIGSFLYFSIGSYQHYANYVEGKANINRK